MKPSSPLILIALSLFSSILSFAFQLTLFNKYTAEQYGLYRYSLVLYPLVVLLYNPGLDTVILKHTLSILEFVQQQLFRIVVFIGLFVVIQIGLLTVGRGLKLDVNQHLFFFMALGLLLGESQSSLRNFLFSHSLAYIVRIPLAFIRVFGILIAIIIISVTAPDTSLGLLVSIIFLGSGGPLSIIYLISVVLRFKARLNRSENENSSSLSFSPSLRLMKEGFKYTFSGSMLVLNDTFLKSAITSVIGIPLYGNFSFLMLPVVEVQKITDMIALNYHKKMPLLLEVVFSLRRRSAARILTDIRRIYSRICAPSSIIALTSTVVLVLVCVTYYFSSLSSRFAVGICTSFIWLLLLLIKPAESFCKLSGVLAFGYRFDVAILLATLPLTLIYILSSRISLFVGIAFHLWPSMLLMFMVSIVSPLVLVSWIRTSKE